MSLPSQNRRLQDESRSPVDRANPMAQSTSHPSEHLKYPVADSRSSGNHLRTDGHSSSAARANRTTPVSNANVAANATTNSNANATDAVPNSTLVPERRLRGAEAKRTPELSVVIPVYNEIATLQTLVERVRDTGIPTQIILVDDGSRDGSRELCRELCNHLRSDLQVESHDCFVAHPRNLGKGAAIRTGIAQATADIVLVQDADLEYDPADYRSLIAPIQAGVADVVYGSRFLDPDDPQTSRLHCCINGLVTWLSNMSTKLHLTDVETCYKVFRRDVIQSILPELRENGFGIELEVTARLAKLGNIRFLELPIRYNARTYAEGKKIGWRDGLHALRCIWSY